MTTDGISAAVTFTQPLSRAQTPLQLDDDWPVLGPSGCDDDRQLRHRTRRDHPARIANCLAEMQTVVPMTLQQRTDAESRRARAERHRKTGVRLRNAFAFLARRTAPRGLS